MKQRGLVMVFALLVLLSLTILGVSAVTSSLSQSKMAMSMQQTGLAFDAAEAAIAGVFFLSRRTNPCYKIALKLTLFLRHASLTPTNLKQKQ